MNMEVKSDLRQSVLVIDDDVHIQHLMRRILEKENYQVSVASDGVTGLSLLKKTRPDLVLLDIMMPGPDGFAILDAIRRFSDVPVIMVSAKSERSFIGAAADLGADDYIEKPFYPSVLSARIKAKLRRVNLIDQTGNDLPKKI